LFREVPEKLISLSSLEENNLVRISKPSVPDRWSVLWGFCCSFFFFFWKHVFDQSYSYWIPRWLQDEWLRTKDTDTKMEAGMPSFQLVHALK
jgi:hypothetical protein